MINAILLTAALTTPHSWPSELDAYIEKARIESEVPGIGVAVVDANGVVAAKGYGVRKLGAPDHVDGDTQYDLASLSKSFTSAMIATLVDEGKLHWDDRVRDVLPDVVFPAAIDAQVTLRDLLAHRTGLESASYFFYMTNDERAEMFRRIRFMKSTAPFRGEFLYNNIMYSVAGAMAERVTGKSWTDLVRERLLIPLGMTTSNADERFTSPNAASPHAVLAGVQQPIRQYRFTTIMPAAAIVSTARDMTRWLQFQLGDGTWEGKRIISAAAMEEMHSPQVIIRTTNAMRAARDVNYFGAYGFGWNVMDFKGHTMLWHSGNADGMPSYMAILPKEKIGVIVMVNTWAAPVLHGALASRILDAMLGLPTRDYAADARAGYLRGVQRDADARAEYAKQRKMNTSPSAPLATYTGTYTDAEYGDVIVGSESDHLTLRTGANGEMADLQHWQNDTFSVVWRDAVKRESLSTFATFALDVRGKPVRLEMRINRDVIDARR